MTYTKALAAIVLGLALTAPAGAETLSLRFASLDGTELPATLVKPEGTGPFPAVVVMHDCSGLGRQSSGSPRRWAEELVALGYVAIMADSFIPRGIANGTCILPPEQSRPAQPAVRSADAYAALAALRNLPYVDAQHIGIMGGSHGGSTTLATLNPSGAALAAAKQHGFAAAIALYPSCVFNYGAWTVVRERGAPHRIAAYRGVYVPLAPLLILIGDKDDWTPAEPCRRMVADSVAAGHPAQIKLYPGAHHSFDSNAPVRYNERRTNLNVPGGKGATIGGDAAAWADAKQQVAAFFSRHLKN